MHASNCTPWPLDKKGQPKPHRLYPSKRIPFNRYIYWRTCKNPPVHAQVRYVPDRNFCDVIVSTPEGKVVYRSSCRCYETGMRRVDSWIEGREGWR